MTSTRTAPELPGRAAPRLRALAALAAAAVALSVLTGCSTERLGAAAVVDGKAIGSEEVQALAREMLDVVPDQDPGLVQRGILDQLITAEVYARAARELGISVRDSEVAVELRGLAQRFQGRRGLAQAIVTNQQVPEFVPPSMLETWMRNQILFVKLATRRNGGPLAADEGSNTAVTQADAELRRVAGEVDVDLSPRYGTWRPDRDIDPTVSDISPLVSGGLSKSVAELATDPAR